MKKVIFALGVVILFATCKKDVPQKQLTVNVTPVVGGSVTPSSGTYAMGSNVKLLATPSPEYLFKEWSGGYTGTTNPASIIMDVDKTITAVFEKREYPLSLTIVGSGTVKEEINANIDKSVVGKHKGDDGGTFGVEGGVQESTKTRLRCFLTTFFLQKSQRKKKISE